MIKYTVIITHLNRENNLSNTLMGLNCQKELPQQVIVVNMGEEIAVASNYKFELNVIQYPWDWQFMPLAGARNFGAAQITEGQLVFLDVDCIPASDFCSKISRSSKTHNALVMGSPKYLLSRLVKEINLEWMKENSVYHPLRPIVAGVKRENCYELF